MAQTVPANVLLSAEYAGQAFGYRILNLDGTTYSAFTADNVVEDADDIVCYRVVGGISAPDEGGIIVWGTSGNDVIRGSIDPAAPTAASIASAVWAVMTSTLTMAGTIGKYITDNLTAASGIWSYTDNEPASVPSANAAMSAKLSWLFLLARNRIIQSSTQQIVYADDGTTEVGTSIQSADNISYTRGEFQ